MRVNKGLVLPKVCLLTSSFLFLAFFFFIFQSNIFAVLMAEGGKEVVVQDPLANKTDKKDTDKKDMTKKDTAKTPGSTSRVPQATLPFSSTTTSPSGVMSAQTASLNNPAYTPTVIGAKPQNITPMPQPPDPSKAQASQTASS